MVKVLFVVKRLTRRIKALTLKLNRLEDLKVKTTQELDGMPKAKSGADIIARIVADICDGNQLLTDLKYIRAACRLELCKLFEKVFGAEHLYFELQTMTYRYAYDYSFAKIAERINYSIQSVYRFHLSALSKLNIKLSDLQAEENFVDRC